MDSREVCFLISGSGTIIWSDAAHSAWALPDSRLRWEAIWANRAELGEIAHSHPLGPLAFSHEDETTMTALTLALGVAPRFSVVAPDGMLAHVDGRTERVEPEPWWAGLMRLASGMQPPR